METKKEIKLSNGSVVLKSEYIKAKTKDLIEFGYSNLTESEVLIQVEKIIRKEEGLTVIGHFCKDDINV